MTDLSDLYGVRGFQGFQGYQGEGPQGYQGNDVQGAQGPQGYQGVGSQGYQGNDAQGAQGPQGYQGPCGFQGSTGSGAQGVQGYQGPVDGAQLTELDELTTPDNGDILYIVDDPSGTPESKYITVGNLLGDSGMQGFQGPQGTNGTIGLDGAQGYQGADGVQGYQGPESGGSDSLPTGTILSYEGTTAPSGWIMVTGSSPIETIGNGSSGADRANSDTEDLFTLYWNSMSDTYAAVSSGRGASAAADYAANKTITLPSKIGRTLIGTGTGSGLTARAHGETGGAETHQLSTAELASHTHNYPKSACVTAGTSQWGVYEISGNSYSTTSTGSDSAHANMQPWTATNYIIKL